jgi:hypothetical protein
MYDPNCAEQSSGGAALLPCLISSVASCVQLSVLSATIIGGIALYSNINISLNIHHALYTSLYSNDIHQSVPHHHSHVQPSTDMFHYKMAHSRLENYNL